MTSALPDGKTCHDCRWWGRCSFLLAGAKQTPESRQVCDWNPSRFLEKISRMLEYRITAFSVFDPKPEGNIYCRAWDAATADHVRSAFEDDEAMILRPTDDWLPVSPECEIARLPVELCVRLAQLNAIEFRNPTQAGP